MKGTIDMATPRQALNPLTTRERSGAVLRLACSEVWGGNNEVDLEVELPGLRGFLHSKPLEPATFGGDVYCLSVCSSGNLSRIVLADVAGHGQLVSKTAMTLRSLLRKHMNELDQSALMREINKAFRREDNPVIAQYATAAVLGYFWQTGELIFTNAGHPAALWYRAKEKTWNWLREDTPYGARMIEGVPLGLIAGTEYFQAAVRLETNDLLVLYTDGITESTDAVGKELGYEGLRLLAQNLRVEGMDAAGATARALLVAIRTFRGESRNRDDESILIFQKNS
jgi:sigma-B regulation protein RsbU (phosphoserine phosphatase)